MKNHFLALLLCAMPYLALSQNLLSSPAFSFEPKNGKVGGYNWIAANMKKNMYVTDEKASKGKYSLKISTINIDNDKTNLTAYCEKVKLDKGDYTLKGKVFLSEGSMSKISFTISVKGGLWKPVNLNTKGMATGQWVEISESFTLDESATFSTQIQATSHSKWGGKAVLYIDDLQLTKN